MRYDIWYYFEAQETELIMISTCLDDRFLENLQIVAFESNSCGEITDNSDLKCGMRYRECIADEGNAVFLEVVQGKRYYFSLQVTGWNAPFVGTGSLMIEGFDRPANDVCSNAVAIQKDQAITFNNVGALNDNVGPQMICGKERAIWYKFSPLVSEQVVIELCVESTFNFWRFSAFRANDCNQVDENSYLGCSTSGLINCERGDYLILDVVADSSYYIMLGNSGTNYAGGTATLQISSFSQPLNDVCVGAEPILEGEAKQLSTFGQNHVSEYTCGNEVSSDLWYTFTPTYTDSFTVYLCDTYGGIEPGLLIYEGESCGEIDINNPDFCGDFIFGGENCLTVSRELTFYGTQDKTYYLRVGGANQGIMDLLINGPLTSIETLPEFSVNVKIYPNPNAGQFTINTNYHEGIFQLFDAFGKLIYKHECTKKQHVYDVHIDVPAGVYYGALVGKDGNFTTQKILIN